MRGKLNKMMQKGSLMVEALALLGLITLVTPIMYKKAAERTTELQDVNLATQIRMINEALDTYVRNDYAKLKTEVGLTDKLKVNANDDTNFIVKGVKSFLPTNFRLAESKFFDTSKMQFSIERKELADLSGGARSIFTSAVLLPSRNKVNIGRAAKIASMVGISGGTLNKDGKFEGTQGAWEVAPGDWFDMSGLTLKPGSMMSISSDAVSQSDQLDSSQVLFRVDVGDDEKNRMETNLLMGGNEIEGVKALFGSDNKLTIGDDNDTLFVKGATEIGKTLKVTGNTDLAHLNAASADISGEMKAATANISGKMTANEAEITTSLKAATINTETLEATGTVKSKKVEVGEDGLTVAGATTLTGKLNANGSVEIADSAADKDLLVKGSAGVDGDLEVGGDMIADNLHAIKKLGVGGSNTASPSLLEADASSDIFKVSTSGANLSLSSEGGSLSDGGSAVAKVADGNVYLASGGTFVSILDDNIKMEAGAAKIELSDTTSTAKMVTGSGEVKIDDDETAVKYDNALVNLKNNLITANVSDNGGLLLDNTHSMLSSPYEGGSLLNLEENSFVLKNKENAGSENGVQVEGTTDGKFKVHAQNAGGEYTDLIVDAQGLAIGKNLTESKGDRDATSDTPLDTGQNVIISRKGFIELASPDSTVSNSGQNTGFIRARRLVSDVKYVDNNRYEDWFDGYDYKGNTPDNEFDYYQVNPAYTSVMNDIKLATRGGARLSDILSNYIIKGIYVADNTYHDGNGLVWDKIPIVNGSPSSSIMKVPTQESHKTNCTTTNCEVIYSCQSANCVASPWMGFVPRPQCPKGYQAVITTNPIRWRMSEIFYLNPAGESHLKSLPSSDQDTYADIIGDVQSIPYGKGYRSSAADRAAEERFKEYFSKNSDPVLSEFTITKHDDGMGGETYKSNINPLAIQTNTWLNSSVSPHENASNEVDGWHILMGFLYRPAEYGTLINDMGLTDGGAISYDEIYWNLFPVYAQDMATIVTTYCSFNRRPAVGETDWKWGAGEEGSPVLRYDQLDPSTYHGGERFDRSPDSDTADVIGKNWFDAVNDPSLPYDDAW